MNKKLIIALRRCSSEQGFAMPIVLGLGLIMLLVGTMMLMRSQGDRVTASTQKATARGLSAAEIGVARIQAFLYSNRSIATYPLTAPTGQPSWANASIVPGLNCNGGSTTASTFASNQWIDIDPFDPTKGQFKVISYTYTPGDPSQPNNPPGTAILSVEGRVNQVGSGSTATGSMNTAITNVQVTIPINPGTVNFSIPGLWLKSGGMSGNQTAESNIILHGCSGSVSPTLYQEIDKSTGKPYLDPTTNQPFQTISVSQSFPDSPPEPPLTDTTVNNLDTSLATAKLKTGTYTIPYSTDISKTQVVNKQAVQVYQYRETGDLPSNFTVKPGAYVTIYLEGNINKNTNITHNCNGTAGCSPTDFQIFGYKPNGTICLNGNDSIDAFILTPTYAAGIDGNGVINGALWINHFGAPACSSNSNQVVVTQTAPWNTIDLTSSVPPLIGSISSWQRQESP